MWNISRLFLGTSWIRDLFTSAEAASVIKSRIPSLPKNNPYIFLYFYRLFSRFPLQKHPAWRLGILRSLKHAIGKRNVWNTEIGICDLTVGSRNLSNSSRRRDQVSFWICIIHFKREILKRGMKSIFHEWIHWSVNEVNACTGLTLNTYQQNIKTVQYGESKIQNSRDLNFSRT